MSSGRALSLLDHGHGVNLDEPLGAHEAFDDHKCAGGRICRVDVPVADFANDGDLRGIDALSAIVVQFDDAVRVAAGSFDSCFQVFEDLLDLGAEIIFANEGAGFVDGDLAGGCKRFCRR